MHVGDFEPGSTLSSLCTVHSVKPPLHRKPFLTDAHSEWQRALHQRVIILLFSLPGH